MTYDEGRLELMSPLRQHENIGRLIGRIVETYTEVKNIEIHTVGSTTFLHKPLQRGFEADESYYIEHAELIRKKKRKLDLAIDPPPDLVIEVEITTSAIYKLPIFRAMGVPEVWRHDGERLRMFELTDGEYREMPCSQQVPGLSIAMIEETLHQRFDAGETALIRQFRASIGE